MAARQDLARDPRLLDDLLQVRRGTAFFARKLTELADDDFADPSLLTGWRRAHLIAHVGYNARAVRRLVDWARTEIETPMYDSPDARAREIELGATLSPLALRHLCHHAAIDLDVAWRDLPETAWQHRVRTAQGRHVPVSETVWMRMREVWLHAIDLDNGATFADVPEPVLLRLLADITGTWSRRGDGLGLRLEVTGTVEPVVFDVGPEVTEVVRGSAARLARWATGRMDLTRQSHRAPRWL
jgi:maleylpyruvate isomerase